MRILIVSTFFPPLNSIASLRPYSWAKFWTEEGHDVTVLTIEKKQDESLALDLKNNGFRVIEVKQPWFLQWLKGFGEKKENFATSSSSLPKSSLFGTIKAKLKNIITKLKEKTGILSGCRMPDLSHFWVKPAIKAACNLGQFDLIVSTAGPYTVHLVAHSLKKKGCATRWFADYRDPWSNNFLYPGLFPINFFERKLEKKLLKRADAITTVSDALAEDLGLNYGRHKTFTILNGFDPDDLNALDPTPIFPDDGKYRIVYTGTIYKGKRDPSPLFEAIKAIKNDPNERSLLDSLEVIFIGPNCSHVDELISEFQIEQYVAFKGFLNRKLALRMQRDANALLFLPWNDMSVDGVLTGKIFEYLFSGTKIIAVGGKGMEASQKLIVDAHAGEAFLHVDEIREFLRKALCIPCKEKIKLNPSFLETYHRKAIAKKMLQI